MKREFLKLSLCRSLEKVFPFVLYSEVSYDIIISVHGTWGRVDQVSVYPLCCVRLVCWLAGCLAFLQQVRVSQ